MSPQAGWILRDEVLPRLRNAVPRAVKQVGAEDADELVQDATCMAAQMMHRNELNGKQVTPGNVSYYTIQHLKSGRRANGSSSVDVMANGTQLNGSARLDSLSMVVSENESGEEIFELEDIISNDHEDPATIAARTMDWQTLMASLTRIELLVIEFLSAGKTLRDVARKVRVSDSTMQNHRRKIAAKILEYMGADVLQQIAQLPHWRINLEAERQSVLGRHERRAMA